MSEAQIMVYLQFFASIRAGTVDDLFMTTCIETKTAKSIALHSVEEKVLPLNLTRVSKTLCLVCLSK